MIRIVTLVVVAILGVQPLAAQNLLANPGFDVADQLSGWTCTTTNGVSSWNLEDHLGSTSSGSMQHDVGAATDNAKIRCSQCVLVNEHYSYVATLWAFWPDDPGMSQLGSSRISYTFYGDAGCTVDPVAGDVESQTPGINTWKYLRSEETVAPPGAQSAMVHVFTWQNLGGQPVRARIDDVHFSTTTIFRDGFESGSTSGWEP